ncbi:MAG: putative colanic acid biosynthesis acetyltransferase [Burkholderiaceae bacterium]
MQTQSRMTRTHHFRQDALSRRNVMARAAWSAVWMLLFRPSPRPMHRWRCWLLRLFGAQIGDSVRIYQTTRIWAPWNLEMHDGSCLGDYVDCYNVARITLARKAVVSQYSYLCAASRDYRDPALPLIKAPITIGKHAWVTADVFVGPGVAIGAGAVITARSTVMSDIAPWVIASGNPAIGVKTREFPDSQTLDQPVADDHFGA